MFGVSFSEIIVILLVALIVVGPKKLPEAAAYIGRLTGELRKTSAALRRELNSSFYQPPIMPHPPEEPAVSYGRQNVSDQPAVQIESTPRAGGTPAKHERHS